jgi:hypothetical protein
VGVRGEEQDRGYVLRGGTRGRKEEAETTIKSEGGEIRRKKRVT